ncbi:MAG: hypothetical protein HZA47_11900 [Planctomycetes bacterium]|uniref:hypothetical protein n=1 Tax=Candidatus Wunengus sp. YC65 TaxID=3367701 RepID=UPI001DCDB18D|nr:hypothetical protein [Planctomycetota bacterium]MBI5796994.1 hypothetical protein [Planctomycetota bacterium]
MERDRDELMCFTIMPSGLHGEYKGGIDESDYVYEHMIKVGLARASEKIKRNISSVREVDRAMPGSITNAIIKSLCHSDFVIADLTGRNPNVFLELGIRYSLCQIGTVLLRQEGEQLPFDIASFKVITYNKFRPSEAEHSIAEFIINVYASAHAEHSAVLSNDSPVYEAIDKLQIYVNGINKFETMESTAAVTMSWDEIMERIGRLRFYEEPYKGGTFKPNALIGITNGGLIMAELISRKYFHGVPLISLWADRWSPDALKNADAHYFTNKYARAAIEPLKELKRELKKGEQLTLLVIDDNVASGTTCQYVVRFLRDELGADIRVLFHPIVCKAPQYLSAVKGMLPPEFENNLFALDREKFIEQLKTSKSMFPYDKDIRGT